MCIIWKISPYPFLHKALATNIKFFVFKEDDNGLLGSGKKKISCIDLEDFSCLSTQKTCNKTSNKLFL